MNEGLEAAVELAGRQIKQLQLQCDVLRAERDHARASFDHSVKLLTSIHSLLYPAPITTPDGRTMVFRPKDQDPHKILQELSDRIRKVPDELEAQARPRPPRGCPECGWGKVAGCWSCGSL